MLIHINLKDQLKGLYLGVINISLNFKRHADEIKHYSAFHSLSCDWSMIAQDVNMAIRKYQERGDEKSQKK